MMNYSRVQMVLKRWRNAIFFSGLAIPVVMCAFLLSSCGGAPVDHPLITGTATFDVGTSTTSERGKVAPIQVIGAQSSLTAYPGGTMSLAITTSPFAVCNLEVAYGHTKPSQIPGAAPITTSSSGTASWRWFVASNARTGTWPLTISANLASGAKATAQVNVTVVFPPLGVISSGSKLAVHAGGTLKLELQTGPSETVAVVYAFGAGKTSKTVTGRANGKGLAILYWGVSSNVAPGVYPVTASEILADGEQTSVQVNVVIS
ncbi:MAG: hypothetical protein ABI406_20720 [Ktedonobacteraceae bacterium]